MKFFSLFLVLIVSQTLQAEEIPFRGIYTAHEGIVIGAPGSNGGILNFSHPSSRNHHFYSFFATNPCIKRVEKVLNEIKSDERALSAAEKAVSLRDRNGFVKLGYYFEVSFDRFYSQVENGIIAFYTNTPNVLSISKFTLHIEKGMTCDTSDLKERLITWYENYAASDSKTDPKEDGAYDSPMTSGR